MPFIDEQWPDAPGSRCRRQWERDRHCRHFRRPRSLAQSSRLIMITMEMGMFHVHQSLEVVVLATYTRRANIYYISNVCYVLIDIYYFV